jgi:RNA polymerase sigma-70 factor (ECF subfamily)
MMLAATMQIDAALHGGDEGARLRRGDWDALAVILPRYQAQLYRFLVRMVGDRAAAEDLFQQTWIRAMEKIGSYKPEHPFDSWIYSIAHNLAVDHLRRKREWSLDAHEEWEDAPGNRLPASGPDPLEQVLEAERGAVLSAAMEGLPAIHRAVLTLRFEEEMKLEEIAKVANIPLSTVKSRLSRALDGLRRRVCQ